MKDWEALAKKLAAALEIAQDELSTIVDYDPNSVADEALDQIAEALEDFRKE